MIDTKFDRQWPTGVRGLSMTPIYEMMMVPGQGPYMFEEQRLETFKNWHFKDSLCSARKLAEAGFIFCGSKGDPDVVQCQVCLKKLHGWEKDDNPWTEHAQHSPSCLFVKIGKRECDMTLNDLLDLHLERTKNLMKEEHVKMQARHLALGEEVRRRIIQLRKLKK